MDPQWFRIGLDTTPYSNLSPSPNPTFPLSQHLAMAPLDGAAPKS